jgi:predicted PurR-regulated permease PerM
MESKYPAIDLARITLAVIFICLLIIASLWILVPFLPALIWAIMIVVSTWPLLMWEQQFLGRRSLAVVGMSVAMLAIFVIPFALAITTILQHSDKIVEWGRALTELTIPPPPEWIEKIPVIGAHLQTVWAQIATMPPEELGGKLSPYIGKMVSWFASQAGNIGMMFVHSLLTLGLAVFLYGEGDKIAAGVLRFARRVAGETGVNSVYLAAKAIRAVALGVVGTALIQAFLAGIGLAVVGFPYTTLLTAVIFMLAVAQIGATPVLLVVTVSLYWHGARLLGTLMLIWTVLLSILDSFLRPVLIRRGGAHLPLILIFAGVIGGLLAFGIKGLFVGPVTLAVSYTLLGTWMAASSALPPAEQLQTSPSVPGDVENGKSSLEEKSGE